MKLYRNLAFALGALALSGLGCAGDGPKDEPGQRFNIQVAPLDGGISDACYKVEVFATDSPAAFNDDPATGNLVWGEDSLCSGTYGVNGELRYTGICRDYEEDTDGSRNAVRLTINSLTAGTTDLLATGFINPCPAASDLNDDNGCIIVADCKTNVDTQVEFDLTVMRQAAYGFFDVAVRFNEIFCAAKVDCTEDDDDTATLQFLQKPNGTDGDTVILGFACFGGADAETGEPNPLFVYLDDITIDCGGNDETVFVGNGPGNLAVADYNGNGTGILFGAAVNQGAAMEGGIYVNVLLGMNTYENCTLTAQGTASPTSLGGSSPYFTPADTNYPYIDFNVTLGGASGRTCTKHPLFGTGDNAGVSAPYTGVDTPAELDNEFAISAQPQGLQPMAAWGPGCNDNGDCGVGETCYQIAGTGGVCFATGLVTLCPNGNECSAGEICHSSGGDAYCLAVGAIGPACNRDTDNYQFGMPWMSASCPAGSFCDYPGICRMQGELGATCNGTSYGGRQCADGLVCNEVCVAAPTTVGAACFNDGSGLTCGAGLYCNGSTCQALKTQGQTCSNTFTDPECAEGLYCNGSTCQPNVAIGGSCMVNPFACDPATAFCDVSMTGNCLALKALDATCEDSSQCADGLICEYPNPVVSGGTCRPRDVIGSYCQDTTWCPNGKTCDLTTDPGQCQ